MTEDISLRDVEGKIDLPALVIQLEELVRMALECENKKMVDPQAFSKVYKQIVDVRQIIDILHEAYLAALKSTGIKEGDVEKYREQKTNFSPADKRMFDTLSDLQKKCEEARTRTYEALSSNRATLRSVEKKLKETSPEPLPGKVKKPKPKRQKSSTKWMKT
jgi:hypothetical protein